MRKRKKIMLTIVIFIATTTTLLSGIAFLLYERIFDQRFEADRSLKLALLDFQGLIPRPVTFISGNTLLGGNFYRSDFANEDKDVLLIFCHGFTNGSIDYLGQIDYFARNGFEVLAYDNTGCHSSTGSGVKGLPQAVINLRDVLNELTTGETYASYHQKPIILMGHSWGGYAVSAVLNEKEYGTVAAVISFSAPNKSMDMLMEQGRSLLGNGIYVLKPFVRLVETLKFGKYSGYSALRGVNNTNASVLALHSRDDSVVSFQSSLAVQESNFENPYAKTAVFDDRGHRLEFSDKTKMAQIDEALLDYVRDFILDTLKKRK